MELIKVEKLDDKILGKIVNKIVNSFNPYKIILFGSYAYGNPGKDSDLDLLIIFDDIKDRERRKLRLEIRKVLREFLIPKDIIVVSRDDIKNLKGMKGVFLSTILTKGKTLYERKYD